MASNTTMIYFPFLIKRYGFVCNVFPNFELKIRLQTCLFSFLYIKSFSNNLLLWNSASLIFLPNKHYWKKDVYMYDSRKFLYEFCVPPSNLIVLFQQDVFTC